MNLTSTSNSSWPEKHFGLWGNLPLSRKLLLAFGALFVLTVLVAIVTLWGLNQTTVTYEEVLSSDIQVRTLADQLTVNLLSARRDGKDYLLRWRVQGPDTAYANYASLFVKDVADMRDTLKQLAPFGKDMGTVSTGNYSQAQYEADLAALGQSMDTYEQSFLAYAALTKARGSDENTGLEGELRTAAHNIETKVSGVAGLEPLEITYLQMRRHEKDYIERNDQTYIDQVHTTVAQLKTQIAAADQLSPAVKTELRTQVEAYLKAFDAIVEADKKLVTQDTELANIAVALQDSILKIKGIGAQLAVDDTSAARANGTQAFTFSIVTVLITLVISIALAITLSQQLTAPIISLTNTAQQISEGNFETQAEVTSADEVGTLAQTFNVMTARLGQAFAEVNRRAAELATVATISTQTATILDPFRMLESAVHLTQRGFGLYHAHVFTYNKDTSELQIVVCGYREGDEHEGTHGTAHIPVAQEQSLVARAARTRKAVIVNDVRSDPGWLPNPLLPDTRAELAVPMIVGEELMGVLDVQSERVDAFTDADANIQTTLASQLATALKNSQSFTDAKAEADLESMVNSIGQKIQRATTVDDTLQTAIREIGLALGASRVSANIQAGRQADGNN